MLFRSELGMALAHHVVVQLRLHADRQEVAPVAADLVDDKMRVDVIRVAVHRGDVAPLITIVAAGKDRPPPRPGHGLGRLNAGPLGKAQDDVASSIKIH